MLHNLLVNGKVEQEDASIFVTSFLLNKGDVIE